MKTPDEIPEGLSYQDYLRYYYAGIAMQGLIQKMYTSGDCDREDVAERSVLMANALIKELEKNV